MRAGSSPLARSSSRRARAGARWPRWLTPAGAALLALAAAALLALPASAAAPDRRNQARLDGTIRFLQEVQNPDGGFGGRPGALSDPLFSAWVAIALAAGGVNPRDQAQPHGIDVYSFLARHADALSKTTDFERAALVAVAAGTSPRRFGGRDLAGEILGRQLPNGAFPFEAGGTAGYVNATAFAILPLSTLHEPAVTAALRRGGDWLLSAQDPTGAWGYAPGVELSSDVTAAVIEALHAAGRTGTSQEQRAWAYIRALQNPDGGFGFNVSQRESNSASTSWIVQAMWAAGDQSPTASRRAAQPARLPRLDAARGRQHRLEGRRRPQLRVDDGVRRAGLRRPSAARPDRPARSRSGPAAQGGARCRRGDDRRSRADQRPGRDLGRPRNRHRRRRRARRAPLQSSAAAEPGPHGRRRAKHAERGRTTRREACRRPRRLRRGRSAGHRAGARRPRPRTRQGPGGSRPARRAGGRAAAWAGARARARRDPAAVRRARRTARASPAEAARMMLPLAAIPDDLGDALARIAAALQVPVLLAAVAVLLLCALELGRFAAETWQRQARTRRGGDLRSVARRAVAEPARAPALALDAPTAFAAHALTQIVASRTAGRPQGRRARARRLRAGRTAAARPHAHARARRPGTRADGDADPAGTRPRSARSG